MTDFEFDGQPVEPVTTGDNVDFAIPDLTAVGDHTFAQRCDGQVVSTVEIALVRPSEGDTGANDSVNLTLGMVLLAGGVFGVGRAALPMRKDDELL